MLFYTVNKQFEVIQIKTIFAQYVTDRMSLQYDKGNNKITELRTILQRESQNS